MTSVYVADVEAAFAFYTRTLGFREKLRIPEARLAIVVSAEDPDGTTLLLEPNDNPIARTYQQALREAGLPVIVFFVEDVAAEHERLRRLGVVFTQAPTATEWGTQAVFDDTCGNYIQLHDGG
ncbi:VOC family protein [Luteimonas aquatica]|uniref:VOC family protein n=1 Tax=Luteimonas aquatica TaxID=450364 RepID=UPI001F577AA9|nr:VOC family protein [Luteimonas aquatica]